MGSRVGQSDKQQRRYLCMSARPMRYTYIKLLIHSEVLNKELFRTASFSTGPEMSFDELVQYHSQKNGTDASKESTDLTMLPLSAVVSSAGQRKGTTCEAAEHFMIVFWLLIRKN